MKEDPKSEQNREPENKLSLDWDLKDIVKSKLRTKPTKGDCKFKQIKKKKNQTQKKKKTFELQWETNKVRRQTVRRRTTTNKLKYKYRQVEWPE